MNNIELSALMEEKRSLLYHFSSKFTSDPDEREDLIQETWIRAFKSIDEFIHQPKLMSWLYVIMKHTYINHYRKTKRVNEIEETYVDLKSTDTITYNNGVNKFVADYIQKAMSGLSEENYEIFRLYLDGYKYHEIGSYFEMPEGTIKTRIHTIRKKLKQDLKIYKVN